MKKLKVMLRNFSNGRKVLLKRIAIYIASSFALYEIVSAILNTESLDNFLSRFSVYQQYIYPILDNLLVYIGAALVFAVLKQFGFSSYSKVISGSGNKITLKVGDIFDFDGGIFVPDNDMFINDTDIIGKSSIHAQLMKKCKGKKPVFKGESPDNQVENFFKNERYSNIAINELPIDASNDKKYKVYDFGVVVPLKLNKGKKEKNFYLFSMSKIKSVNNPSAERADLIDSLHKFWDFLRDNHEYIDIKNNSAIPLLGTGAAGGNDRTKQEIAEALIKTYADRSSASNIGIDHLTVYIYPGDYDEIDMDRLRRYIDYVCEFPMSDFERPCRNPSKESQKTSTEQNNSEN